MTVTSPQTALRQLIIETLNAEFAADEIVFTDDRLHSSLGTDGPIGGVYPSEDQDMPANQLVIDITCYVQLYGKWEKKIDPTQSVSPALAEERAERVRRALQAVEPSGTPGAGPHLWDAHVTRITYPQDPTGNITRFEATVMGRAQNPSLVETTG